MKRLLIATLIAGLLAIPSAAVAQGAQGLTIKDVDVSDYPQVVVTVSTEEEVAADELFVLDNGRNVDDATVEDLSTAGQDVSVVLLIDTSGSMQGEPMAAAKRAAQDFIQTLPDDINVGVVAFADDADTVVGITSDHAEASEAISGLEATGETALYDGVEEAVNAFEGEGQRNIVLLSDGGDTASDGTLQTAVSNAKDLDASIYAVGLKSGEFDAQALKTLARETNGRYAPAATADLSTVYENLAAALSQQFVITYESTTEPGDELELAVSSEVGDDSVILLTPDVAVPTPGRQKPPPPSEPQGEPLLAGTAGKAVVLFMTFLTVLLLMLMILGASSRRHRERELARRIQAKPKVERTPEEESSLVSWIPDSVMNVAEDIAANKEWGYRLEARMESAGWPWRPAELVAVMGVLTLIGLMVGASLGGFIFALLFGFLFGAMPMMALSISRRRRLNKIQDQLPDVLMILASSLRAGHSFLQALDSVAKEIGDPANKEFQRVVAEIRLGRKIEEALSDLATRVESEDFEWAILAVNIQREVGGNLAEILDTVAETIRERGTVRRQIDVLSSEGRLSVIILAVLPFGVASWMGFVNPEYIGLLFTTRIGIVMVMGASALMAVGIYWMRKVVKIDV